MGDEIPVVRREIGSSGPKSPSPAPAPKYDPSIYEATVPPFSVTLTPEQVAKLAYMAGFRGQDLIRIVAIAGRESRYNTAAYNGKNQDRSVGLWQINMLAHGERFGTRDQLHDPWVNAQAAFALYQAAGNSLSPWTTYDGTVKNGTSPFIKDAEEAVTSLGLDKENAVVTLDDIPVSEFVNDSPVGTEFPGLPNFDNMDEAEIRQVLSEEFPQYIAYLEIPELRDIIVQAASEGRDAAWLKYNLEQTKWWQNTNDTRRSLLLDKASDPASYFTATTDFAKDLRSVYIETGLKPPAGDPFSKDFSENDALYRHAESFRLAGMPIEEIKRSLVLASSYNPNNPSGVGSISDSIQSVQVAASDFLIKLSDEEAFKWGQQLLAGEITASDVRDYFRDLAIQRFSYDPNLVKRIKDGFTPDQLFSANREEAARTLEIDKDQIDWSDPKFAKILDSVDQNGVRRAMTVPETRAYLRTLPDIENTRQYQKDAAKVALQLGQEFGYI